MGKNLGYAPFFASAHVKQFNGKMNFNPDPWSTVPGFLKVYF
jgi:hypothetical protein